MEDKIKKKNVTHRFQKCWEQKQEYLIFILPWKWLFRSKRTNTINITIVSHPFIVHKILQDSFTVCVTSRKLRNKQKKKKKEESKISSTFHFQISSKINQLLNRPRKRTASINRTRLKITWGQELLVIIS